MVQNHLNHCDHFHPESPASQPLVVWVKLHSKSLKSADSPRDFLEKERLESHAKKTHTNQPYIVLVLTLWSRSSRTGIVCTLEERPFQLFEISCWWLFARTAFAILFRRDAAFLSSFELSFRYGILPRVTRASFAKPFSTDFRESWRYYVIRAIVIFDCLTWWFQKTSVDAATSKGTCGFKIKVTRFNNIS